MIEKKHRGGWAGIQLDIEISFRVATEDDLEKLEWFGLFREHREIFRRAFDAQCRGANLMIVAILNGLPVGQIWIDLEKRAAENTGLLWALRVVPWLQGCGIGSRLIRIAEEELARREYEAAELGVEKENRAAEALYRRLGYVRTGELSESYSFTNPDGRHTEVSMDEWVYRKELGPDLLASAKKLATREKGAAPGPARLRRQTV